jgi:antitoxin component of MazEF toxin-antitoxin module
MSKEKEYSVKRKVYRQGGSLLISLPKIWVDREGIKNGDELEIRFDSVPGLKVLPTK